MTLCGRGLHKNSSTTVQRHSGSCLHALGHHGKSRGLWRAYAAAVVSEKGQRSSANGSGSSLDILNAGVASRRSLPASPEVLDLPPHGFDSIESALEALRTGDMVVVLDDEDRENEGDLIMAADKVSTFPLIRLLSFISCVLTGCMACMLGGYHSPVTCGP